MWFHPCAKEKKGSNLDLQRELHGGFERLKEPIVPLRALAMDFVLSPLGHLALLAASESVDGF